MKKTVKTILVVLVLSVLLILGYKYFFKGHTNNFIIRNNSTDIVINATTSKSNQTLTINKYFSNDFTVDRGDGSEKEILKSSDDYVWDGQIYPTKIRHTYKKKGSYNIVLSLLHGDKRRKFQDVRAPLIENTLNIYDQWGDYEVKISFEGDVSIISMPTLADGFGESKEEPGDYFFAGFNGAITGLPKGSFDTSGIKKVGDSFFANFGASELPEGSFDTSNITTVGNGFFQYFNNYGELTKLPEGSFNISKITTVGNDFFKNFNYDGSLTELPEGSFYFPNITEVGYDFFTSFNERGDLIKLPEGSFDLSNITTVGHNFFQYFNHAGAIEKLPEGSFDISNIRKKGKNFFKDFNSFNGKLSDAPDFENIRKNQIGEISYDKNSKTNIVINIKVVQANQKIRINKYFSNDYNIDWGDGLVEWLIEDTTHTYEKTGSYDIILSLREGAERWTFGYPVKPLIQSDYSTIKEVKVISMPTLVDGFGNSAKEPGNNFFAYFNYGGAIKQLPEGSFDTSKIEVVGDNFFEGFNWRGALTELPEGSFDTSNIKIVGDRFFRGFNTNGLLTKLPEGSFDISNIEKTGAFFLYDFSPLKNLPEDNSGLNGNAREKRYFFYNLCFEDIKENARKNLGISGNFVEVAGSPWGTEISMSTGYYYIARDYGRMGWALYYKDAGIIIKQEDMSCEYDLDGNLTKLNYNPDRTDLLKKLGDDRYLTTEGRLSLCNAKIKKNWTMEILKPDYYTYVEIESRGITSGSWKTECRIHFDDGKIEIIDHMAEMNKPMQLQ